MRNDTECVHTATPCSQFHREWCVAVLIRHQSSVYKLRWEWFESAALRGATPLTGDLATSVCLSVWHIISLHRPAADCTSHPHSQTLTDYTSVCLTLPSRAVCAASYKQALFSSFQTWLWNYRRTTRRNATSLNKNISFDLSLQKLITLSMKYTVEQTRRYHMISTVTPSQSLSDGRGWVVLSRWTGSWTSWSVTRWMQFATRRTKPTATSQEVCTHATCTHHHIDNITACQDTGGCVD